MYKTFIKPVVIVFLSSVLVACAAQGEPSDSLAYEDESRGDDCISQSTIRDYQVLDEGNLIVTASARRNYHVVLRRRAFGLRSTWQVGFRSPMSRICSGTAELIFDDGFGRTDGIQIASIRELSPEGVDELLIRFGKKDPEFEQAPVEADVPGAEVEELD